MRSVFQLLSTAALRLHAWRLVPSLSASVITGARTTLPLASTPGRLCVALRPLYAPSEHAPPGDLSAQGGNAIVPLSTVENFGEFRE
jgi:hypothetical protein